MSNDKTYKRKLEEQIRQLDADLYQVVGFMDVCTVESLCRRKNITIIKLHSFKGGLYE
jgi:hypothetical protein